MAVCAIRVLLFIRNVAVNVRKWGKKPFWGDNISHVGNLQIWYQEHCISCTKREKTIATLRKLFVFLVVCLTKAMVQTHVVEFNGHLMNLNDFD